MRAFDRIEDIRVAWERALEREISRFPFSATPRVDPGSKDARVPLDEIIAGRVWRVARDAAERLGCTDRFELVQTPAARLGGAQLLNHSCAPFVIRLIGPTARLLDDAALRGLIGHEVGHFLALGPHARPSSSILEDRDVSIATRWLCHMASELTAERFALLAAGELEALVRFEVCDFTWDDPKALGVSEREYLAQACERIETGRSDPFRRTSPCISSDFRLYASALFERSDVWRELSGSGTGELTLRDVDAELYARCKEAATRLPATSNSAADKVAIRPPPTRSERARDSLSETGVAVAFGLGALARELEGLFGKLSPSHRRTGDS